MNEEMKNPNEIHAEECECGCCGGTDSCLEESVDLTDKITFNLSNGETFYVDPNTIDWAELYNESDKIKSNLLSLNQMMIDLIVNPDNEELIDKIYESIEGFANDLRMDLDYSKFIKLNPKITKRETVIIACHDMTNVVSTFLHHIEINNVITSLMNIAADSGSNENPFDSEEFEKHIEEMSNMIGMVGEAMSGEKPIPSPEEFEKQMKEVVDKYPDDPEASHGKMDDLMMDLLNNLGYGAAVKVFDDSHRWYA